MMDCIRTAADAGMRLLPATQPHGRQRSNRPKGMSVADGTQAFTQRRSRPLPDPNGRIARQLAKPQTVRQPLGRGNAETFDEQWLNFTARHEVQPHRNAGGTTPVKARHPINPFHTPAERRKGRRRMPVQEDVGVSDATAQRQSNAAQQLDKQEGKHAKAGLDELGSGEHREALSEELVRERAEITTRGDARRLGLLIAGQKMAVRRGELPGESVEGRWDGTGGWDRTFKISRRTVRASGA